jgi:hypothetical protein
VQLPATPAAALLEAAGTEESGSGVATSGSSASVAAEQLSEGDTEAVQGAVAISAPKRKSVAGAAAESAAPFLACVASALLVAAGAAGATAGRAAWLVGTTAQDGSDGFPQTNDGWLVLAAGTGKALVDLLEGRSKTGIGA